MSSLSNYVDFLAQSFGRRYSSRLSSAQERLERLVDDEFPSESAEERAAMVGLVLLKFGVVPSTVQRHSMITRSMM
jgi:hypothetical protein